MSADVYYANNSHLVELDGLKNAADNSYVNDATVAVSIKDDAGNNVTGETWPVALSYVAGSNGKYQANIAATLGISVGDIVTLFFTATAVGLDAEWQENREVRTRHE